MNPSSYDYILEFVKKNNQVLGMKYISLIDGEEYFFKRIDEQALAKQNSEQ